ncbi:bacteriorhodopsin [Kineococcus sp. R8]|uniref:bacteriorhodopsin-like n=1 Tax=Kineococcus siccus TaxID=2696567 RepID=UPI001412D6EE|nr:bacteriorhodopsin-like [Kineococcus siccus]NAZ81908.1 bacteriorhodopsin [Kineococcus siccus]
MKSAQAVPAALSASQYATVYNVLSLALAALLFTAVYLVASKSRVAPRYRNAVVVSAIVCSIAAYHYFRIFENFGESYPPGATADAAHALSNVEFNEGYRYVDWLLTVPLLLVETVAVMALAKADQRSLLYKLVPASALMIILGYPGEITLEIVPRAVWGLLSTIPFVYILYVLFVELSRSIVRQPVEVQHTIKMLRIMLVGLWGIYPIAYLFPIFGELGAAAFVGSDAYVLKQVGYSVADILAKAAYGLVIFKVARVKSALEDGAYADDHTDDHRSAPRADGPRRVPVAD